MRSDDLGVLDGAAVFQIRRDAGRSEGVVTGGVGKSGLLRPPFHHLQHVAPDEGAVCQLPFAIGRAEQGQGSVLPLVWIDPCSLQIFVYVLLGLVVRWNGVELAALLMQAEPCAAALQVVVVHAHSQYRRDTRKAVDHDCDQRPITQPHDGIGRDGVQQLSGVLGGEDWRFAAPGNVLRPSHRRCGIEAHHLAGHQPIEQDADRGEMLLDRRRGQLAAQQLDIGRKVHRLQLFQRPAVLIAPSEKPLDSHAVGCAGVRIADVGGKTPGNAAPRSRWRARSAPARPAKQIAQRREGKRAIEKPARCSWLHLARMDDVHFGVPHKVRLIQGQDVSHGVAVRPRFIPRTRPLHLQQLAGRAFAQPELGRDERNVSS
jgi:hypothetical protein